MRQFYVFCVPDDKMMKNLSINFMNIVVWDF